MIRVAILACLLASPACAKDLTAAEMQTALVRFQGMSLSIPGHNPVTVRLFQVTRSSPTEFVVRVYVTERK